MKRVLIVDDGPENLYLLRALLEGSGYEVDEARHGAEALTKARQTPPALIISDLLMPVMDGYTLLRQWKADARLREIPFVVYTATYTEPKDERLALDLGADAFILKPAEPEPFMIRLREVLERKRRGALSPSHMPQADETVLLKEYSAVLVQKLEEKIQQLGQTSRALEEDNARRQQVEAALRESEERFRATFEQAAVGIAQVAPDGRWLQVNRKLCDIVGYSRAELLQCTFQDITHPADLDADLDYVRRMLAGEIQTYGMEKRYLRKDGTLIWIHLTVGLVRHPSGEPKYFISVVEDATERKQAQEALEQSEQRLRNIFDGLGPDMFVGLLSTEGVVLEANQQALAAAGLKPEDVLGKPVEETYWFSYSEDSKRQMRAAVTRAARGEPSRYDVQIRVTENQFIPLDFSVQPFRDTTGRVTLLVPSAIVITERKLAEQALRESEERLRLALDAAHMGTFDWDVPGNRITWSRWHDELWGFKPGEFSGTYEAFAQRVHPDDLPGINAEVERCVAAREPFAHEFRVVWPDGSVHWITGRGEFTFNEAGAAVRMHGAVVEITERKQAEAALLENARELETLSRRLLSAQEDERRHIARELHDELGQALTAIKINLQARGRFEGHSLEDLDAENIRVVDGALQQVRQLALTLRPSMLDDLGLGSALRWMADQQAGRGGLAIHVGADFPDTRLAPELETACFRIAQEALTNIVRHAQARSATIELRHEGDRLVMTVQDDGRGFDVAAMRARARAGGSMGLLGMQERAVLCGGNLAIESSPERGTMLRARFPWQVREEERRCG